jgi:hypothetical protein
VRRLWEHLYGDLSGILALFSGVRAEPGCNDLGDTRSAYFDYPRQTGEAEKLCLRWSGEGREVYHCAHLLNARRRMKENAAPVLALYADGDGAKVSEGMPEPTAVGQSSPRREQFYWRLTEPIPPELGEGLNRRLALAMGADDSGWDLSQLLRPPATRNRKYPGAPLVRLLEINDSLEHDPQKVDRLLPPEPDDRPGNLRYRANRPADIGPAPDLAGLSPRIQNLILHGNSGQYKSRSEADMAACVAMFGAGYAASEVWAVMADPANGISEKFLEKGRDGERFLSLTIGKAEARAQASSRCSKSKARRVRRAAK